MRHDIAGAESMKCKIIPLTDTHWWATAAN